MTDNTDDGEKFDLTPGEGIESIAARLEHRLDLLEKQIQRIEAFIQHENLEIRRLRKLMEIWVTGH